MMDPRSSPGEDGLSSPAKEAGPGPSDTSGSVATNTMPGENQQNVVGDRNIPIMNIGGQVNMIVYNSSPEEKSKPISEKNPSDVVGRTKRELRRTEKKLKKLI